MSELSPRAAEILDEALRLGRIRLSARLGYTEREAENAERQFLQSLAAKPSRVRKARSETEGHSDPHVPA